LRLLIGATAERRSRMARVLVIDDVLETVTAVADRVNETPSSA
jgi:hypothetical protein